MKYKELKAGDVRQEMDEVCRKAGACRFVFRGSSLDGEEPLRYRRVNLIGHPILPIDLRISSFRRPLP